MSKMLQSLDITKKTITCPISWEKVEVCYKIKNCGHCFSQEILKIKEKKCPLCRINILEPVISKNKVSNETQTIGAPEYNKRKRTEEDAISIIIACASGGIVGGAIGLFESNIGIIWGFSAGSIAAGIVASAITILLF